MKVTYFYIALITFFLIGIDLNFNTFFVNSKSPENFNVQSKLKKENVTGISKYFSKENIDSARIMIDKYLVKYPDDIDVLMMAGNVILNEYLASSNYVNIYLNPDESIYDNEGIIVGEHLHIVPEDVANEVASIWKYCLSIDKTRKDIHMGLGTIYSWSLMVDSLISHYSYMKESLTEGENLFYIMGDYAQNLIKRNEFEKGIKAYEGILRLYPNKSGLYSDIGGAYFQKGNLEKAEEFFRTALEKDNPDEMVLQNVILLNSILGNFDIVLQTHKKLSEQNNDDNWLLYKGLFAYSKNEPDWKNPLNSYLKHEHKSDFLVFMMSNDNKHDYKSYLQSTEYKIPMEIHFLLQVRAVRLFQSESKPFYNYGELLTYYKYFDKAVEIFSEVENNNLFIEPDDSSDFIFRFAWALENTTRNDLASDKWKLLFNDSDFYRKSAGIYFYGKYLMTKGQRDEAFRLFEQISDSALTSKYGAYALNIIDPINFIYE